MIGHRCIARIVAAAGLGVSVTAWAQDGSGYNELVQLATDPGAVALLELLVKGGAPVAFAFLAWWTRDGVVVRLCDEDRRRLDAALRDDDPPRRRAADKPKG